MRYKLSCRTCWNAGTGMLQMLRWDLKSSMSTGHPDDTEHSSSLEHSPSIGLSSLRTWQLWSHRREILLTGQFNRTHQYWTLTMSKLVPILSKSILKSTLHWQSFCKERHWTLCRTRHEAQVWKLGGNSWEGLIRRQSVGNGRCWVVLSILEQWTCMSCHEPLNNGKNVSDRISREREKKIDDLRSGILTEMCPEHIKTHIHLNLTRLPDYAYVRSEIETFLEARQSTSNPDAMNIGSLNGQKGVCRNCGQRGHWAASCPKRGKSGGKGDDGKGQCKKGKSSKDKADDGKGKGKGGKWQARKAFDGYCNHCWKWGHMEKNCVNKSKGKFGKGRSASSLDESEKNGSEDTSVGGFGLCSFRNHCDDWKWKICRKVTFTLDSGAAVSAAPKSLGDDYPMQIEEPRSYRISGNVRISSCLVTGFHSFLEWTYGWRWNQMCNATQNLIWKKVVSSGVSFFLRTFQQVVWEVVERAVLHWFGLRHRAQIDVDIDKEKTCVLPDGNTFVEIEMCERKVLGVPQASQIRWVKSDCSDGQVHQDLMVEPLATVELSLCSASICVSLAT